MSQVQQLKLYYSTEIKAWVPQNMIQKDKNNVGLVVFISIFAKDIFLDFDPFVRRLQVIYCVRSQPKTKAME